MPCAKPKFCTLFITGRNWVVCVVLFEPEKSDVNRQALFTNVNYIVGTSACHCFVHCINDKCVFMQITYFLKIIIFSSIQHLWNDARFLLYRNPWSRINRTANLNYITSFLLRAVNLHLKISKIDTLTSHSTNIFEIFGTLIIIFSHTVFFKSGATYLPPTPKGGPPKSGNIQ